MDPLQCSNVSGKKNNASRVNLVRSGKIILQKSLHLVRKFPSINLTRIFSQHWLPNKHPISNVTNIKKTNTV